MTRTAGPDTARRRIRAGHVSPLRIEEATQAQQPEWDAFVAAHDAASGYHVWAWRDVFERSFGHESTYLLARRNGRVDGILPLVDVRSSLFGRSLTSLPFVNYGGIAANSADTALSLMRASVALARARGCRHVEFRHLGRQFPETPCRQHKVAMRLPLADGMWEHFDRKVRNQIRKAQKSGLVAERGGAELLRDFYAVFARNMRDLGTPVYGRQFFVEILRAFPEEAAVVVVRKAGAPIACGISYRSGTMVEVPWASSIRDYNALCPNHLLYWSVIEAAVASGCQTLDFGRSTPNEGTYRFKSQWGAEPVALYWEYPHLAGNSLPDQGPTNPKFRAAIALWKRSPLWLANRVGPRIVRAIP